MVQILCASTKSRGVNYEHWIGLLITRKKYTYIHVWKLCIVQCYCNMFKKQRALTYIFYKSSKWRFPKMMVPPNHPSHYSRP